MAIELASKIFGSGAGQGLQVSSKSWGKRIASFQKNWSGCWARPAGFRRSLFYGNLPPSMVHGEGKAGEKKEKDFCWGTTAHSTTSPFWEQFFKGKAKMERYSPVKFDLLKWVDFLKIKNFKGIFSRDSKDHLHKTGSCIINLDDKIGNGTHWVATDIKGKNCFLF